MPPTQAPPPFEISPRTTLGAVQLGVSDLARSLDFYQRAIGLALLAREPGQARLGRAGHAWLELVELPGARPARGHTGLFHFALRLPQRQDLARWLAHARDQQVALTGVADHFVSEAIYLDDPDGHGIEIYWDRPRERWEGRVAERMTTLPLDIPGLLGLPGPDDRAPYAGLPEGTDMGHVHLRVADVPAAIAFYQGLLGFGLMARYGPQAAFFGAGGYHHHVGANTWESLGAGPPPAGVAGLRRITLVLPDAAERQRLLDRLAAAGVDARQDGVDPLILDPSGIRIALGIG